MFRVRVVCETNEEDLGVFNAGNLEGAVDVLTALLKADGRVRNIMPNNKTHIVTATIGGCAAEFFITDVPLFDESLLKNFIGVVSPPESSPDDPSEEDTAPRRAWVFT